MHTFVPRNSRGQSLIVLGLLIAFFVILAVGLFSFELNRVEIAREQLRTATESAALAAAATLASQDNVDPVAAHLQAQQTALESFKVNTVMGHQLSDSTLAASAGEPVTLGH